MRFFLDENGFISSAKPDRPTPSRTSKSSENNQTKTTPQTARPKVGVRFPISKPQLESCKLARLEVANALQPFDQRHSLYRAIEDDKTGVVKQLTLDVELVFGIY